MKKGEADIINLGKEDPRFIDTICMSLIDALGIHFRGVLARDRTILVFPMLVYTTLRSTTLYTSGTRELYYNYTYVIVQ